MITEKIKPLYSGIVVLLIFVLWTLLIKIVDVHSAGESGTLVGFATINTWFHKLTGVHMWIYTATDWLGLVPVAVCMIFAIYGLIQLISRRSLFKVDLDIILLGIYYIVVIAGYLAFEMYPVNYRPILIEGRIEASYPSSTTLLVLSVMPTLIFQVNRRIKSQWGRKLINVMTIIFTAFMVIGRLVAGVHWLTDIIGSVLLCAGLFLLYKGVVILTCKQ